MMENVSRNSVAFDPKQLKVFDNLCKDKGYANRSEAIRDLIRRAIVDSESEAPNKRMLGTLTIVFLHHSHDTQHELTEIEHHSAGIIRSALHIHIDLEHCLEVMVLEGKVRDIKSFSDKIMACKGVKHGKLVLTHAFD